MRMSPTEEPEYWRDRAEHIRAIAEVMTDPPSREMMLRVAGGYDRIAEHLEDKKSPQPRPASW
jgi:hypothetical protein